jgi:hypothetical protein
MRPIASAWPHGWVRLLVIKLYLSGAVIVLLGARVLLGLGLLGSDGIGLAVRWSERLVRRAASIWRAEQARAAEQRTRSQLN